MFKDEKDSSVPVVIYMPLIKNEKYSKKFDPKKAESGYCNTFNFLYSKKQFDELSGLTRFNMLEAKNKIWSVVIDRMLKKSGQVN